MKNISQIVNRVATLLAMGLSAAGMVLTLTACGQRGALYLPTTPAAAERASLVDALTKPSTAADDKSTTPSTPTTK